jgi:hypothetical protein
MHDPEFYERQRLRAYTYNGEVQVGLVSVVVAPNCASQAIE